MSYRNVLSGIKAVLATFTLSILTVGTHAAAQETVLFNFNGATDGSEPGANLIFDAAGNLYGTSPYGGDSDNGVVFELSPQAGGGWTEQVLYSFVNNGKNAFRPQGGLVFDAAGNLYGTTSQGGMNKAGTVFELSPASGGGWNEYVLHNFGAGTDGSEPAAGLIMDAAGNLYGTTTMGGAHGDGTVFELTSVAGEGWREKVLHSFSGTTDGSQPWAGLTFDAAGNLYGTTVYGGTYSEGTVFQLTSASGKWSPKLLHTFGQVNSRGVSTYEPYGGVIFDQAGNLYGTSYYGGGNGGGTVYELTPTTSGPWKEVTVRNLGGSVGANPLAGLAIDSAGNLYGTTVNGGDEHGDCGSTGCGTVFELTPSSSGWVENTLLAFDYTDGGHPTGTLIFDATGNLYGTTAAGGTGVFGTAFEIAH